MGIDDTIERRKGTKIQARGIYRDPVRSSHSHFVKVSGLRWLVIMTRLSHNTDLTDDQWQILEPLIPAAKPGGRPLSLDIREILNGIFYLQAFGIKWRAMPHDLPRWPSVYTYFRAWEADGTWQVLNNELRVMRRLRWMTQPMDE